jgi:hypothetical protein
MEDDDIDANFEAIARVRDQSRQPPAPAPVPTQVIGGEARSEEQIRSSPGYARIAAEFEAGAARFAPRSLEEKLYGRGDK